MPSDLVDITCITLFHGLSTAEIERLRGLLRLRDFPAKSTVLSMEQPSEAVYFLIGGTVKICRDRKYGANVIVNICGPGEVLGDIHALRGRGHTANVICREPCQTLWMPNREFRECVRSIPTMGYNLLLLEADRMADNTEHEDMLCTQDVPGRLAAQLLKLAHKFGQKVERGIVVTIDPTQGELAAMIGASRASVNAALTSFQQSNYICRDLCRDLARRITILNAAALAARCQ